MSKSRSQQSWQFLTEDVEAILEGSRQAEFDHIYPADPTLFDRFLVYLGEVGVREALDQLPDRRCTPSCLRSLGDTPASRPGRC